MRKTKLLASGNLHDCASTTQAMSQLINQRNFSAARTLSNQHQHSGLHLHDGQPCRYVHFWFQLSLANNLLGQPSEARKCFEYAQQCPDYTPLIEGDFMRDEALALIRLNELDLAGVALKQAQRLHAEDLNRMAALVMVRGRRASAVGNYVLAERLHRQADEQWRKLGDKADQQWIKNNRFYWLKAAVMSGADIKGLIYLHIVTTESNRKRLLATKLMYHLGRPGVKLVERFM
ncbi:hypothetical protein CYG49_02805 [Candidatus Saccharibacteria bacterium]|nr:MAG: hypothetical protein CYG49_02805 [Candidatus Saccharibacteria bacterium]